MAAIFRIKQFSIVYKLNCESLDTVNLVCSGCTHTHTKKPLDISTNERCDTGKNPNNSYTVCNLSEVVPKGKTNFQSLHDRSSVLSILTKNNFQNYGHAVGFANYLVVFLKTIMDL